MAEFVKSSFTEIKSEKHMMHKGNFLGTYHLDNMYLRKRGYNVDWNSWAYLEYRLVHLPTFTDS